MSEQDYSSDDQGYSGRNPNRVRGGQKAAETRRKRGTGFFENASREEMSELGRKGGRSSRGGSSRQDDEYYSGRHPSGYNDDEIKQHRREGGRKAAETRRKRGTGFFENASREQIAAIGRKGGSRSFGDEAEQDYDEDEYYEEEEEEEETPKRRRR